MNTYAKFTRFPEISDIGKERNNLIKVITESLENKFKSEDNFNTSQYAQKVLDGYCYVPVKHTLWEGRFCRYLSFDDIMSAKLKQGGFVIHDNGYTVTLKSSNRIYKVNKRNKYWFMTMTVNDHLAVQLKNMTK